MLPRIGAAKDAAKTRAEIQRVRLLRVDHQPLDARAVGGCRQPLSGWLPCRARVAATIHAEMIVGCVERSGVERGGRARVDRERCNGWPIGATSRQPPKLMPAQS